MGYAIFTIAHLGVFAFLFQVFDDRGAIMQICCYTQLAMLLLCLLAYVASHLLDIMVIQKMIYRTRDLEHAFRHNYDINPEGVKFYTHRIFAVNEFEISPQQNEEKQNLLDEHKGNPISFLDRNSYTATIFDTLIAVLAIMVECLTIAYVYNNTRGEDQGQGETSQQTLTAISTVCQILGLG